MRVVLAGAALALVVVLTGCAAAKPVTMPDVLGEQLDVALSDIERAGFSRDVEVLGGGLFGVIDESNWQVCEQVPAAGEVVDNPRLTVDRTCAESVTDADAQEPEEAEPTPYTYTGPQYEVVVVDEDVTPAKLKQHWVFTAKFDTSTDAYKTQVKQIISDIARTEGTDKLLVQIVTDREIVEAESDSMIADFMTEHGADYFRDVIAPKEKTDWVAYYAGGFDYDTGEPSDDAFAIDWWIASDNPENEKWKAEIAG